MPSRLRHILRRWLLAIAAVGLAAACLFLVLSSTPVENMVRNALVKTAARRLDADVAVARFELFPWKLGYLMEGLDVRSRGTPELSVTVDRFAGRLSLTGRVRAEIVAPVLALTLSSSEDRGETTAVAPLLESLRIERLRIERGRLLLRRGADARGEPLAELAVSSLLTQRTAAEDFSLAVSASLWLREGAEGRVSLGELDLRAELAGERMRIAEARLERQDLSVTVNGELRQGPETAGELNAAFRLAARLVDELEPGVELRGDVEGQAALVLRDGKIRVQAELSAVGLGWRDLGPWRAQGALVLEDERVELSSARLEGYAGLARLSGSWNLTSREQHLDLAWSDLDVARMLTDVTGRRLQARVRSTGDVEVATRSWESETATGQGELSVRGDVGRAKAALRGRATARLDSGALDISRAEVDLGPGRLVVGGRIARSGELSGDYSLRWQRLDDLSPLPELLGTKAPPIDVQGSLAVRGDLRGTVRQPRIEARIEEEAVTVEGERVVLGGEVMGDADALELRELAGRTAGGRFVLSGTIPWSEEADLDILVSVEEVDLCAVLSTEASPVCGILHATGSLTGPLAQPRWAARGAVERLRVRRTVGAQTEEPGRLEFSASSTGGGGIALDGLIGTFAGGAIQATGRYEPQTATLSSDFQVSGFRLTPLLAVAGVPERLTGRLDAEGSFQGSASELTGAASIALEELELDGRALPSLSGRLAAAGSEVLELEASTADGGLALTTSVGLERPWILVGRLSLNQEARSLVEVLAQILETPKRISEPVATGRLAFELPLTEPGKLTYRGTMERLAARYGARTLAAGPFDLTGDWEGIEIEGLQVRGEGLDLTLDGTLPFGGDDAIDLSAEGRLPLALLSAGELRLEGSVRIDALAAGTWRSPRLSGSARIEEGQGSLGELSWQNLTLQARLEERDLVLETLSGRLSGGTIEASGSLRIDDRLPASPPRLDLQFQDIDLMRLTEESIVPRREYVRLSGRGSLSVPLLDVWGLAGTLTLETVHAGVRGNEMQSLEPTTIELAEGRLRLEGLELTGGGTDLDVSLSTDLEPPIEDLVAEAEGALDLSQLGLLTASLPGLEIGGQGKLDLTVRSSPEGLTLEGSGSVQNGRVASVNPRFFLSDLDGELAFRDSAIRVRDLRGRLGGGTVEARASISLESLSELETVVAEAEIEEASLNLGEGMRGRVSGDVVFQGRGDRYRLKGDLRLLSGLFTREIDAASSERDLLSGIRAELRESESAPFADRVELDIRLATRGDVYVDNELTRVTAGGNLIVEGTVANPELTGVITTTREGNLVIGRNTFNLESARITLDSYPIQPARIDISAQAEISGSTVRLELTGTPDDIETRLSSPDPRLTQGDLGSLLLTGRRAEAAPEATGGLVEARAATYLGELFQEQLGLGLVFDTPATLPILASEADPESRFTVGRRLSEKLTIAYSLGLEDAERQLWIVDYQPLRRLWLRGIEEGGEAFTLEIAQRLSFELGPDLAAASPRTRVRVGSVEVTARGGGADVPDVATHELPIRQGDRYDYWRAEDAAAKLRRRLEEAGYLGARVDVEASEQKNGAVDLRFAVDAGPQVRFSWQGDDPGDELRKRIEGRWRGQQPPGLLASNLARQASEELASRGYYQARVTGTARQTDNVRRVVFEVDRGPRGKAVVVDFEGNTALSDEELIDVLPDTDDARFFAWIGEGRGRLEDAIAVRYAEKGYLDVVLENVEKSYDAASGRLRVTLAIEEGALYTVDDIVFSGAESLPREQLLAAIELQEEEVFELELYREATRQVRRLYRAEGFPEAQARSRVRRDGSSRIDVILDVEEGAPATIGQILITGNQRTPQRLIRRQLDLETGVPLRPSALAAAERELYRLGVFRSVEVRALDPPPGERRRDIEVRIVEKPDLFLDYGLRYRTDDVESLQPTIDEVRTKGLEGVVRVQLLQPLRRGGSATFSLFGSSDRQRGRIGYEIPHIFGRFLPTDVFIEIDEQKLRRLDLDSSGATLTLQQRRQPGPNLRLLYGLQLQRGRFDHLGEPRPSPVRVGQTFWLNKLSSTVVRDVRDHVMNPRRGSLSSLTLQLGSKLVGADFDFARVYAQYSLFVPLGSSARAPVWASAYRAGVIFSDEPFTEFQDGFTAGGPFSVRGFRANSLGPTFPPTGDPVGGQGVLIFNQELRFPIWDDLWGGVFYDAGNVFAEPRDVELGQLRQSFGLGLRYDVGFGVIRVDFARVVDPGPGEAKERAHLSFGHAF